MQTTVRRCTRCGREDLRERWSSLEDAAKAGAQSTAWACPSCAWPEAELVEASPDAIVSATPGEAPPDAEPTEPDAANRTDPAERVIDSTLPLRRS